jgi:SAM-dependent methyltransferase
MRTSRTALGVRSSIDEPRLGSLVSARGFSISGWVSRSDGAPLREVRALHDGEPIAATRFAFRRPDVNVSLGLPPETAVGFEMYVDRLAVGASVLLDLEAEFAAGPPAKIGALAVRTSDFDAAAQDYGTLGDPGFTAVLGREDIYSVGPPSPVADPTCVERVLAHTAPGERIVDVGCGVGAYAEPLLAAGRRWHGCEVVPEFVDAMRARGLDVTRASGTTLPFGDAAFDLAISIEVLEHIDDYPGFLREIARVVRRGALFSVPNSAAIPRCAPLGIVPWHLLERSHVNFFTPASLRRALEGAFALVEVTEYNALAIPAADGTPLYNHLFAVAMHA